MIITDALAQFLITAKKNTYAAGITENVVDDAKESVYEQDEYSYKDRYYGTSQFSGEEIVKENGVVIWSMNYYGGLLVNNVEEGKINTFLKKALLKVPLDIPFRGPKKFIDKDFKYENNVSGNIRNFKGTECIFYKKIKVYSLEYHGGIIKN